MAADTRFVPPTLQRELLSAVGAQRGHFRYESGHHGDLWLDLDTLFVDTQRTRHWAAALAHYTADLQPEVVCGPLTGGAFLAQLLADEMGVGFAFAARSLAPHGVAEYEIPAALHAVVRGRRVLLVDDAINAGSAVRATSWTLLRQGATLAGIACLLALGSTGAEVARERAVSFVRLAAVERGMWLPERCPLCAAGVVLAAGP